MIFNVTIHDTVLKVHHTYHILIYIQLHQTTFNSGGQFNLSFHILWQRGSGKPYAIQYMIPEFLISSYGEQLAQRASYLVLHSSLFGPDGTVNYDYIITNSINSLLIGSKCLTSGPYINHCWANLAHASKHIKNSA